MTWRMGSLFAGVGGIDLGLHAAGVGTTAWFSEYDKDASAVLAARFPRVPNHGDVTAIDWNDVEPVDVLVGGPPCQPASSAGKRLGEVDERWMWPEVVRAAGVLRPRYLLMENPAAILSLDRGRPWGFILSELAALGYVGWWDCLRASDVGAPHRRERVFLFAADTGHCGFRAREHGLRSGQLDAEGCPVADTERCEGGFGHVADLLRGWAGDAEQVGLGTGAPTDPSLPERGGPQQQDPVPPGRRATEPRERPGPIAWGAYAAAIARWEHALGRAAPPPVDDRGRLNAAFSEWMMGFPEGWVTDVLPRNPALRCIGNAVVPHVAAVVGAWLLSMATEEVSA